MSEEEKKETAPVAEPAAAKAEQDAEKKPAAKKAAKKPAAKAGAEEKPAAAEAAPAEEQPKRQMTEAEAILAEGEMKPIVDDKKKKTRSIPAGIAFVRSTFNNTQVSITDARGGVIAWSTAGKAGFKGSRKCTAFAATMVAQDAARQAYTKGMHEVEVRIQGAGAGRESAVRAIQSAGIHVTLIKDCTPIPHNGCRPRKRRRV
ncbi:MAG: 30S ribosomal protein S11 [Kiritimatiellae bacterium]|nr:30S ribosomal protein S11 [Kiritimatiellia bacterium]